MSSFAENRLGRLQRRRRRPTFLDTMADVEASQNALLASASSDEGTLASTQVPLFWLPDATAAAAPSAAPFAPCRAAQAAPGVRCSFARLAPP